MKRSTEYEQYELPFNSILLRVSGRECESADRVVRESRLLSLGREPRSSVIPKEYDASQQLAELSYCLVRLTTPSSVVETGVARGVTSYYILRALEENRRGRLYSIELPVLRRRGKQDVGSMVPLGLRQRWTLIYGVGAREMKKLHKKLETIDVFVHDSDHSYRNQIAEYRIALTWLKKKGILISDDVSTDALLEAREEFGGELMTMRQAKSSYVGIIVCHRSH